MSVSNFDYKRFPRTPCSQLQHIPGDSGWPIVGDTFSFLKDAKTLTENKYRQYGPVFRVNSFFQNTVVTLGPEANEAVFKNQAHHFSNKLAWDPTLDRIFPNGLMLMDFDQHKYDRKILQGAFKKQAIEGYLDSMAPRIQSGLETWPTKQPIFFYQRVKSLLLDVAAEVFLGIDIAYKADSINQAFIAAVEASTAVIKLPLLGRRWQRGLQGRATLEQFIHGHLDQKRQSNSGDFFAQICRASDDDGQLIPDRAIVDHIIFLLFAAHDTTTSTLCSIIYSLAKHPRWQERLREEIVALDSHELTYDDCARLENCSLVFREALRMYPPLPVIPRRCIQQTDIMGYTIPENASVGLSPLFTHYMEEYWNKPEQFDPDRFSKQRAEDKKHFFQFVPFGGGHHKCLGLNFAEIQSKLFLFHFLRHYRVSVDKHYSMKHSIVPLSLPTDGLPVRIESIHR